MWSKKILSVKVVFDYCKQGKFIFLVISFVMLFTLESYAQPVIKSQDSISQVPTELKKLYENLMIEKSNHKSKADEPEIDGLIFDETRSKAGHDFYEIFFNNWEAPAGASNFAIYISEMPFLLNLSIISVKLNDYEVLNTRLQPRGDFINSLATDAVNMTKEALLNLEDLRRQVEQGDQIGTGIY